MNNTKNKGLESISYRMEFSNALSATAVWAKAITSLDDAPPTIVVNDGGKNAAAFSDVNRSYFSQSRAFHPVTSRIIPFPSLANPTEVLVRDDQILTIRREQVLASPRRQRSVDD
jgi:hypothetical protein